MAEYIIEDDPKMLRETLCRAQAALNEWRKQGDGPAFDFLNRDVERLGRLINECDRHRPIGPDGKHGNRHTDTCGCEDKKEPAMEFKTT